MEDACFSGPAVSVLTAVGGALATVVATLFWQLRSSTNAQIADAKAREAEWRRVALRGAEEIIPELAREVRVRARDRYQELREPEAP
jgi:hypothetical protein